MFVCVCVCLCVCVGALHVVRVVCCVCLCESTDGNKPKERKIKRNNNAK